MVKHSVPNRVLPRPAQPGLFRVCLKCRAWFALQLIPELEDKVQGSITTYRCKACDATFVFSEHHPNGAI